MLPIFAWHFKNIHDLHDALSQAKADEAVLEGKIHSIILALSHPNEAKIWNMGNAGRNGGEYYAPRPLIHANTLAKNISDIQDKDRYDVILANPPFGGKERKRVLASRLWCCSLRRGRLRGRCGSIS